MRSDITPSHTPRTRRALVALLTAIGASALIAACGGGGDTPLASAGTPSAQSFTSGPISGLGSIIVGGVRFDDSNARVENSDDDSVRTARELKLGMMVEVRSSAVDASSSRASAALVRVGSEMVGPVASIDMATQRLRVLDQTVEIRDTTAFDKSLAGGLGALVVGQVLEIHAMFDASTGRQVATRVETPGAEAAWRLRGRIAALDVAAKRFKIGDTVIDYATVPQVSLPALADGLPVRVQLQSTSPLGPWVATRLRSNERDVQDAATARLHGLVSAYTSAHAFELRGIAIDAANARFEPNAAAVKLGAIVAVRGRMVQGKLVATDVKVHERDDDDIKRVELHGEVSALDVTAKTFVLREVKVNYGRVATWKNGRPADLANGKKVEVKGLWSPDKAVLDAVTIAYEG